MCCGLLLWVVCCSWGQNLIRVSVDFEGDTSIKFEVGGECGDYVWVLRENFYVVGV